MILLTGGSGRLGRELQKHMDVFAPLRNELDIFRPVLHAGVECIVHAAAFTDVAAAEEFPWACYKTNVIGTLNMARLGVPLVYISTEYVFDGKKGCYKEEDKPNPVNVYAASKLGGEDVCRRAPRWLIIRTLFKPRPFQHENAIVDQWTSGDYVDVIGPKVAKAIRLFMDGKVDGILNIGTERKSTYHLAKQSRAVGQMRLHDVPVPLPMDTSLDLTKMTRLGI